MPSGKQGYSSSAALLAIAVLSPPVSKSGSVCAFGLRPAKETAQNMRLKPTGLLGCQIWICRHSGTSLSQSIAVQHQTLRIVISSDILSYICAYRLQPSSIGVSSLHRLGTRLATGICCILISSLMPTAFYDTLHSMPFQELL